MKKSDYQNSTDVYKQLVMNQLVCSGYENEHLAKWALTNKEKTKTLIKVL